VENRAKIKASGINWILFHRAFYSEIKANRDYITNRREAALLDNLEQETGKLVLRTTDFVKMPVQDPQRLNVNPDDHHPSLRGMRFCAEAVAEALLRSTVVAKAGLIIAPPLYEVGNEQ